MICTLTITAFSSLTILESETFYRFQSAQYTIHHRLLVYMMTTFLALEYLLEYVAIFLLRGVGHDFLPSPLTDAIDQTRARDLALGDVVLGAKLQKVTSMAY